MLIAVAQQRRMQCPNAFRVSGTVLRPSRTSKHSCCSRRCWSCTARRCRLAGAWPRASCTMSISVSAASCCSTRPRGGTRTGVDVPRDQPSRCSSPRRVIGPLCTAEHRVMHVPHWRRVQRRRALQPHPQWVGRTSDTAKSAADVRHYVWSKRHQV